MPYDCRLACLIQTSCMFMKERVCALPSSILHLVYSILPCLSVLCVTHWINSTLCTLSAFPMHCLTWNRCCLGVGILSIHCYIIIFCQHGELVLGNLWVRHDCFPAPSPKGMRVRSCSTGSVWHVQIYRTQWKECHGAKSKSTPFSTLLCWLPVFPRKSFCYQFTDLPLPKKKGADVSRIA